MRIPSDASVGVKEALRDLDQRIGRIGASRDLNLDLKGQRATNAGKAEAMADYTTLAQVLDLLRSAREEIVQSEAKARAELLAQLTTAAQTATAPAALGDLPAWLAAIFAAVR